jgi:RNA polymerase sigma-70 factor (ECF subfamily)
MYDDLLVNACRSGDVNAFEELVRKYQNRIVRVLYLLLENADDAQDAAQETFIHAFRSIGSFRGNSSIGTWLHRIAVNTARNWVRDNKRYREIPYAFDGVRGHNALLPEEILSEKERSLELWSALRSLPQYYREAIVLRHYDELSYEEIAMVQQVPVGTVRSRLAKGRELLRQYMTHTVIPPQREGVVE